MIPPFMPKQSDGPVNMNYFDAKQGASALNESVLPKENVKVIKQNQDQFSGFYSRKKWAQNIRNQKYEEKDTVAVSSVLIVSV